MQDSTSVSEAAQYPTEADWYRCWQGVADLTGADNAQLTVRTGAKADRLSWVFMSGYQAAVRACFPEFAGSGWSCFAAAEPNDGPACRLEIDSAGYRLHGEKSWIAGAESVDRLVVSVGKGDECRFVCVARNAPGLTVSLPRTPSFLAEMSQGAAAFHNVAVGASRVLASPERAYWFRGAEPLFVLLALNSCLAAHARMSGEAQGLQTACASALDHGIALSGHLDERQLMKPGLAELRSLTAEVIARFAVDVLPRAVPGLRKSWEADRRLFQMFGVAR